MARLYPFQPYRYAPEAGKLDEDAELEIHVLKEIVTACRRNGVYTNLPLVLLKTPFKLLELVRI